MSARLLILFAAALLAGAINSAAGGGTLLTFPALLSVGVPSVRANATSTASVLTGSFGALFGYRSHLRRDRAVLLAVLGPCVVGGFAGAFIVAHIPDAAFSALVPWLILGATALFMAQEPLRRWTRPRAFPGARRTPLQLAALGLLLLVVSTYGGFFGAGMGILMLAVLGLVGFTDLHEMNALKNLSAVAINGVATVTFALVRKVDWPLALVMAAGATLGGYGGAGLARRVGQAWVRRFVILVGLSIGGYFLVRR